MDNLFLLLFIVSFACLIAGLVKPSIFSPFLKERANRKFTGLTFGATTILFFILFGVTSGASTTKNPEDNSTKIETKTTSSEEQTIKTGEDAKKKAEDEQKELKTSTMNGELPKINFSGEVSPSLATKGEKVVIKVDIENLSDKVTIDDIRLLFSDKSFVSEGLTVVNIIGGGQQDTDRSFMWKGVPLMVIPPKEKRSFQIITQAKNSGNYKSIISIKSNSKVFSDPEGNEELTAKLVVIQ